MGLKKQKHEWIEIDKKSGQQSHTKVDFEYILKQG
jgi:hypothetical protein